MKTQYGQILLVDAGGFFPEQDTHRDVAWFLMDAMHVLGVDAVGRDVHQLEEQVPEQVVESRGLHRRQRVEGAGGVHRGSTRRRILARGARLRVFETLPAGPTRSTAGTARTAPRTSACLPPGRTVRRKRG